MKYLPLILTLGLASCSTSEKDESEENKEAEEKEPTFHKQIIGRIASVSATGNFVLIQKYSVGKMPVNAIIQTSGENGRHASLKPSGERVQNFFAADLVNGQVEIGDAVVAYYDQKTNDDITPIGGGKVANSPESPEEPEQSEDSATEAEN